MSFIYFLLIIVAISQCDANLKRQLLNTRLKTYWLAKHPSYYPHRGINNRILERKLRHRPISRNVLNSVLLDDAKPSYRVSTHENKVESPHVRVKQNDTSLNRSKPTSLLRHRKSGTTSIDAGEPSFLNRFGIRFGKLKKQLKRNDNLDWFEPTFTRQMSDTFDDDDDDDDDNQNGKSKLIIKYEPEAIGVTYNEGNRDLGEDAETNTNLQSNLSTITDKYEMPTFNEYPHRHKTRKLYGQLYKYLKQLLKTRLRQRLNGVIDGYIKWLKHKMLSTLLGDENADNNPYLELNKTLPNPMNRLKKTWFLDFDNQSPSELNVKSRRFRVKHHTNSDSRFLWFAKGKGSANNIIPSFRTNNNRKKTAKSSITKINKIRSTWFVVSHKGHKFIKRFLNPYKLLLNKNSTTMDNLNVSLPSIDIGIPLNLEEMLKAKAKLHSTRFEQRKNNKRQALSTVRSLPKLLLRYNPVAVSIARNPKYQVNADNANEQIENDPVLHSLTKQLVDNQNERD